MKNKNEKKGNEEKRYDQSTRTNLKMEEKIKKKKEEVGSEAEKETKKEKIKKNKKNSEQF